MDATVVERQDDAMIDWNVISAIALAVIGVVSGLVAIINKVVTSQNNLLKASLDDMREHIANNTIELNKLVSVCENINKSIDKVYGVSDDTYDIVKELSKMHDVKDSDGNYVWFLPRAKIRGINETLLKLSECVREILHIEREQTELLRRSGRDG